MTDTDNSTGPANKPRRAEPLQPDRPGRGDETEPSTDGTADGGGSGDDATRAESRAAEQQEQLDTALENVRKGYD